MNTPQECVVAVAKSQVGYYPTHGKFNKYAEALDRTDLYNYAKNGYDWATSSTTGASCRNPAWM